jgi:hypothetical protein
MVALVVMAALGANLSVMLAEFGCADPHTRVLEAHGSFHGCLPSASSSVQCQGIPEATWVNFGLDCALLRHKAMINNIKRM